jgi:Tat protein translocase TatB subunit
MFGTLGGPELLLILVIALIVFGPRKLPEIGKSLGKMMVEFRRASNDFKRTIEEEVEADKMRQSLDATSEPARIDPPPPVETAPVETAPIETAAVETAPVETAASEGVPHEAAEGTVPHQVAAPDHAEHAASQDAPAPQTK